MLFLRTRLSASALIAALLTAAVAPVWAAAQTHPVCASKQHDCGQTSTIAKCCCGDQGQPSNQGGPAESRVQITADLTAIPGASITAVVPDLSRTVDRLHGSPPRTSLLDLPTLFSSLLI